jgi:steroid delta-isomerase-like uncharacterized protein
MAARNVETAMEEHKAFNRRDFSLKGFADDGVYIDTSRGLTMRGKEEARGFLKLWTTAMSNAEVYEPSYIDAGDVVVAQFTGRGTQDGPFGPFPPSGKEARAAFCEVFRFDQNGKIAQIAVYYDQLSLLAQLGHIPAPK